MLLAEAHHRRVHGQAWDEDGFIILEDRVCILTRTTPEQGKQKNKKKAGAMKRLQHKSEEHSSG